MATKKKKVTPEVDIEKVVADGHTEGSFDWSDWLKSGGVKLAEAPIDLYNDQELAYEALQLEIELAGIEGEIIALHRQAKLDRSMAGPDEAVLAEIQGRRDAVIEKLVEVEARKDHTKITLDCRGVSKAWRKITEQGFHRRVGKKPTPEHLALCEAWKDGEIYRKVITKVTVHEHGQVRDTELTNEEVQDLFLLLPESEEQRLRNHFSLLTFGGVLADRTEDAGFLGGGDDLEEESPGADGSEDGDGDEQEA